MASSPSLLSLSVVLNGDRILQLPPLAPSVNVATIKMLIEAETNVASGSLVLLHKQRVLTDAQTLGGVGVASDEMLEARTGGGVMASAAQRQQPAARPAAPSASQASRPAPSVHGPSTNRLGIPDSILRDPSRARDFIRTQPGLMFQIESQNPPLYRAVMSNDLPPFAHLWKGIVDTMEAEKAAENEAFRLANADPMDPTVQAKIEEAIRLKNVQENWEMAMEHAPESFGRVIMLYVPMSVNGCKLQAFVDSGAQSTIMSVQCAERCGIMRLLDRRYAGIAKGVGSAKILGRVHQVPCTIGSNHVSMSFTILENQGMDFLLGLDQLKNHQACIDLGKNVLRIQGEEIPFLSEKDLPGEAKNEGGEEDEAMGSSSSAAASSSGAAAKPAASSSAAAAAASASGVSNRLTPSGHNVSQPTSGVPSSLGSVASAAHRPAGALSASVPPPAQSPLPSAANAAAVAAAQRRAAEASAAPPQPARPVAAAAGAPVAAVAPPPARAAVAPPAAAAVAAAASGFPEEVIEQLVGLGFGRAESIQALQMCNGNAELAAGHLFNM